MKNVWQRFNSGGASKLGFILKIWSCILACCGLATAADVEWIVDPRAKLPIERSVAFLKTQYKSQKGGHQSLLAYTFLKAGDKPTSPEIVAAIEEVKKKNQTSGYQPHDNHHAIYEAATDIMLLADANAGEYRPHIEGITTYILKAQRPDGAWTYPGEKVADTSITQYGLLGLWAAERSGVNVSLKVWNDAARWLLQTQMKDGGFTYWPGTTNGAGNGNSYPNMTFAGTGCLLLSRIYIYGDTPMYGTENRPKPKKFGVLDDIKSQNNLDMWAKRRAEVGDTVQLGALDQGIGRGLAWISSHWSTQSPTAAKGYFFYSLERVGALSVSDKLGGHDWFNECLPIIVGQQDKDGSWNDITEKPAATALHTLFLTRTTGRIIEKLSIAGGMQIGGRGLPDDLSKASVSKGKVKERKSGGSLDDLLSELSNQDASVLEDAQAAIVEKVQIGNREELLGQLETVRRLVKHPSAEVRRTAVWALGRSGQLSDALAIIQALNDNDVDVLVEANASLKFMSRKLSGVGVPESPFEDLPEGATEQQKIAAVAAWKREALRRWSAWYSRVRPFEQRNDLFELLNRTLPDEK